MADEIAGTTDHLSEELDDTALADSLALGATTDDPQHEAAYEVGEQLLSHRTTRGLSLEEAASLATIGAERLASAEEGLEALDSEELERLANAYGVAVDAFFGGRVTPFSYLAGA